MDKSPLLSPAPATPSQENKPAKSGGNKILKTLLILLLLLLVGIICAIVGAGSVWYYYQNYTETEDSDTTDEGDDMYLETDLDDAAADSTEVLVEYEGDLLVGEYPEGWSIVEYLDGAGSDMMVTGVSYVGLTGLEIINPDGAVVFRMKAVSGIGGMGGCENYYEFADSSVVYYNEIVAESTAVGLPATVVDLTASTYAEFELFDYTVRRINTELYYDKDLSTASFDAACGITNYAWWLDTLQFSADGFDSSGYEVKVVGTPLESEMEIMDDILDSLVTI